MSTISPSFDPRDPYTPSVSWDTGVLIFLFITCSVRTRSHLWTGAVRTPRTLRVSRCISPGASPSLVLDESDPVSSVLDLGVRPEYLCPWEIPSPVVGVGGSTGVGRGSLVDNSGRSGCSWGRRGTWKTGYKRRRRFPDTDSNHPGPVEGSERDGFHVTLPSPTVSSSGTVRCSGSGREERTGGLRTCGNHQPWVPSTPLSIPNFSVSLNDYFGTLAICDFRSRRYTTWSYPEVMGRVRGTSRGPVRHLYRRGS